MLGWLEVIAVDCCNVLSARPYVINHSYVTMLNCVIYSERCCVAIDRLPSQWNGTVSYNACSFVFTEQPNILQNTPLDIGSRLNQCKGQLGECASKSVSCPLLLWFTDDIIALHRNSYRQCDHYEFLTSMERVPRFVQTILIYWTQKYPRTKERWTSPTFQNHLTLSKLTNPLSLW